MVFPRVRVDTLCNLALNLAEGLFNGYLYQRPQPWEPQQVKEMWLSPPPPPVILREAVFVNLGEKLLVVPQLAPNPVEDPSLKETV